LSRCRKLGEQHPFILFAAVKVRQFCECKYKYCRKRETSWSFPPAIGSTIARTVQFTPLGRCGCFGMDRDDRGPQRTTDKANFTNTAISHSYGNRGGCFS